MRNSLENLNTMEPVFHRGHRKRETVGGWGSESGRSDVDKREFEGGGGMSAESCENKGKSRWNRWVLTVPTTSSEANSTELTIHVRK